MGQATNYVASQVTVILDGALIEGFADGDFITIEPNVADRFTHRVGADGEVLRSRSEDDTINVTFVLLQGSKANDVLSRKHQADLDSPNGTGGGSGLHITDHSGTTIASASRAWIRGFPTITFGTEGGTREWRLTGANTRVHVGGNRVIT